MQTTTKTIFSELAHIGDDGHSFFDREWLYKDLTDSELLEAADLALESRREATKGTQRAKYSNMVRHLRTDAVVAKELAHALRVEQHRLRESDN